MKNLILLISLSIMSISAGAHEAKTMQDTISVTGVGEVEAEPDQLQLDISVNAHEATLTAAKKAADDDYRTVLAVIEKAGIDEQFVRSTRISAQPQYDYQSGKRVYKGEQVSRSLQLTINDLDVVPELMQALVDNGVSTIDGTTPGFQDRKALMQKALAAAADDAQSKAKFLAERLGRNLGSASLISEHNSNQAPRPYQGEVAMARSMSADAAPPPPEMFGLQKVQATVNVTFNLL